MDCEVSALMGAVNEELWEKKGLFSSVDELCGINVGSCNINASLNAPLVISSDTTKSPLAGKQCSSQPCRATFHSQGNFPVGLGSKEGVGFARKNNGSGINSGVEGAKLFEFSKLPSIQTEGSLGGHYPSQRGFAKRVVSAWKPKKTNRRMVMGVGVGLEDSCTLSLCALVGRYAYRSRCKRPLDAWMASIWEPVLVYSP